MKKLLQWVADGFFLYCAVMFLILDMQPQRETKIASALKRLTQKWDKEYEDTWGRLLPK